MAERSDEEGGPNHAPDPAGDGPTPVVGIGASAGGLAALQEFFRGLPPDPGMAFVVVQHLAPDHESEIAKILQHHTGMPVRQVEDGQPIAVDHVFTIPPGRQLELEGGRLRLSAAEGRHGHVQSPIDMFLRSIAAELGEAGACVILSGTGSDGTLGLKAVKEAGGITLVQSPGDAEYDGMPRSAVGTGLADITGSARELAQRLVQFRRDASAIRLPSDAAELAEEGSAALPRIFAQLRSHTGHDFSHYKRSSVLRRIGRRLQVLGMSDLPTYVAYARETPRELDALLKDLLISVTSFFRDPGAWEFLAERVVPKLFEGKRADDTVRVWVPGCATGEEAYSIGMLLCEHAAGLSEPPQIQIFATDIDTASLSLAREAVYTEAGVDGLTGERRKRFFDLVSDGQRVRKSVRELVLFAPHNLLRDPPFSRVDLVSCRNLLIYLNRDAQETVFELFHYALRADGYLFLGSSETADGQERRFATLDRRYRVFQRRGTLSRVPSFPTVATTDAHDAPGRDRGRSLADHHRDWLVRHRVPPSVLVDSNYEICHSVGGAHRFLREVDGVPGRDVVEKVLPELRLDLRTALFQAFTSGEPVRTRAVPLTLGGERCHVALEVVPLDEAEFPGRFAEVLFDLAPAGPDAPSAPGGEVDLEVAERLEEELTRTRERLRSLVEEYESVNEELQASNEELQSMNEELRSTTEELQSSKEELQSMNEELVTLNQELRNKIEELARANGDLKNLMAATRIGTIFLDRALRIQRYTPAAEDLFHLQPADLGRPLRALTQKLEPGDVVTLAAEVLRTQTAAEREQQSADGRWFITRIQPYRSVEDVVEGVVLTFVEVTRLKEAERRARFQADILGQVQDAVIALDCQERIVYLNAAACDQLELDPGRARGRRLSRELRVQYASDDERTLAEAALSAEGEWTGEVERTVEDGRTRRLELAVTALTDEDGVRSGTLAVLRDRTEQRDAERLAHERQRYLKTALRNVPIAAAIVDRDLRYRWVHNPHPDFTPEEVIGKRDDELMAEAEARRLMALKREVLERRVSIRRELHFERSDGTHVYDMTVDPLFDANGDLVGLTTAGLDVTDRKRYERALEAAKGEAEAANESKSAFLAAMSHELRTPLNAVTGYVDLLELGVPDAMTEAQAAYVSRIRFSARHLLQLIEEILLFARVDAGRERAEPVEIPVHDLVEEVQAILEPLARQKNLDFRVDVERAPERVRSDARKLRQILLNVLGNAVKFTHDGRVELRIVGEEGRVVFQVADTGEGISEVEISQIFQPFWQSDSSLARRSEGTGLGLAICQRYLQLLGGTIRVGSELGAGSVFTIELPQ